MCHPAVLEFGRRNLHRSDVAGKKVLEVGAYNVNGSLREKVLTMEPDAYLGVDLRAGPGVDEVCDAGQLIERYGPESCDLVICTEMLEHAADWMTVCRNLKGVLRPGGVLLLTTRSPGFPWHEYPGDHWRFEPADLERIFGDLSIEALEPDPGEPGVFLRARKPSGFRERDLSGLLVQEAESG